MITEYLIVLAAEPNSPWQGVVSDPTSAIIHYYNNIITLTTPLIQTPRLNPYPNP